MTEMSRYTHRTGSHQISLVHILKSFSPFFTNVSHQFIIYAVKYSFVFINLDSNHTIQVIH